MTKLSAIQHRVEKATKGPWSADNIRKIFMQGQDAWAHHHDDEANAAFIAHSREDILLLLEVVKAAHKRQQVIDAIDLLEGYSEHDDFEKLANEAEACNHQIKIALLKLNEQEPE